MSKQIEAPIEANYGQNEIYLEKSGFCFGYLKHIKDLDCKHNS